jgi:hypothetical protein
MQEMYLAHDLQMKLLPNPLSWRRRQRLPRALSRGKCGGDFYHLFRIPAEERV